MSEERIYSADELRKLGIVGRDARRDFRNRANADWKSHGNSSDGPPASNPYRAIYEELTTNRTPRTQKEKNRVERYRILMEEQDALLQEAKAESDARMVYEETNEDFQKAKDHFVTIVQTMPVETAEDASDVAAATQALQNHDIEAYYRHTRSIADRRIEAIDTFLEGVRERESDAKLERASAEVQAARLKAASLQPPRTNNLPTDFDDPR